MGRYPAPYKQSWNFEFKKKMSQEPQINFYTVLMMHITLLTVLTATNKLKIKLINLPTRWWRGARQPSFLCLVKTKLVQCTNKFSPDAAVFYTVASKNIFLGETEREFFLYFFQSYTYGCTRVWNKNKTNKTHFQIF